MLEAGAWGLIGASSLVLGAILAPLLHLSDRALGAVLAFGAGVLISAVAYELVEDATGGSEPTPLVALGFALGALVFFLGSEAISRLPGGYQHDGPIEGHTTSRRDPRISGAEIVLGAVLDGIPESVVLGLSLIGGGTVSVPVLAAIFISNVPESLGASTDLAAAGVRRVSVIGLWVVVALVSGAAAGLGYLLLHDASPELVSAAQTFAAGAIVAMLAESMIPEAYEKGGRLVGLATAFGFACSAALSFNA